MNVRTLVAVLSSLIIIGCAEQQKPKAKAPPPPDPTVTTEKLAFEAERRINAAEKELNELRPDAAVEELDAADVQLANPDIDRYPDAQRLRERHRELQRRVPDVREEVRKRELAAAVAKAKEKIEIAKTQLKDAIVVIRKKDPAEAELKGAQDLVDGVRSALDEAENLESKDAEYSKYALATRKDLADRKKAVEQRVVEVSVERGREEIGHTLAELANAVKRIAARDVVDGDFDTAKAAWDEAQKMMSKHEPLASKEPKFGKWFLETKTRLEGQRAAIDKRKLDITKERQKLKVEEGKKALAAAMQRVDRADVVEAEFTDAENAAKTVDDILKDASALDASYKAQVQKLLADAKNRVEKRKLEVEIKRHRALVSEALASLNRSTDRMKSPEDVQAAEAAVGDVEKAIDAGEKYAAKDAGYSKFALEARKSAVGARKKIREQGELLAMEAQKAKVDTEIENVKSALAGLDGFSVTEEQFTAATGAIGGAKKALEEGVELEKKLARYNGWASAKRKWVETAENKVAKRKNEIALRERKLLVEQAYDAAKAGVDSAKKSDATNDIVKEAEAALKIAREEIQKGSDLEKLDRAYANQASNTREKLDKLNGELNKVKSSVAFREGPVQAYTEGMKLIELADSQLPEDQQKAFSSALEHFKSCKSDGASILGDHPQLASAQFVVARKKTKATGVLTMCGEQAKKTETKLAGIQAAVEFYEGPARSFTKARSLLDQAAQATEPDAKKKATSEALTEFEICIEKGKLLQHKHPELSKAKFDVDGQVITLPFVVTACQKEAKSLRGAPAT